MAESDPEAEAAAVLVAAASLQQPVPKETVQERVAPAWARGELEMKFETLIGGRAGTIQIDGAHFRYEREDGRAVEGEFSIEKLEPGCHSVLIEGRSFRVTTGVAGVEVFDPRSLARAQGR